MTETDFNAALAHIASIVGKEWVYTDQDTLNTYRDSYSPFWDQPEERLVSAAVAPSSTEQVQAIVAIANEFQLPVYPISTGKNLGYGGSAPNLSGSVVIDLKRMNKILEVNASQGFALVEPGVSYFDLYNYIQENNLPVWIDCPEPGWGSVLGNALDHGFGYTHQNFRDHFSTVCGMEVVLPTGKLMRTGMGAMPGNKAWQSFKYSFGPYIDGLFSQSNMGIVTKLGIHLFPRPDAMVAGAVAAMNYRDIIPLMNAMNELEMSGLCDGLPQVYSPVLGGFEGRVSPEIREAIGRAGGAVDADLERVAKGAPYWTVRLLSYGPLPVAREKWRYAKEKLQKAVPTCFVIDEQEYELPLSPEKMESLAPLRADMERKVNFAIPNLSIFAAGTRSPIFPKPTDGHIWFSPTFPRSGEELIKAQNVFNRAMLDRNIDIGLNAPLPGIYTPRSFFCLIPVFLYKDNPEANRNSLQVLKDMIDVAAENGWAEYRAAPALQDYIQNLNSFGDHAYLRFCETIKDAVDPNGIISAGRYGIWPKHIRDTEQQA
jgi:4-cresol dehydrogenase (hydroxylating)